MKLLSAEMSVIWKPMTLWIWYTWNSLLSEAYVLIDLNQESCHGKPMDLTIRDVTLL